MTITADPESADSLVVSGFVGSYDLKAAYDASTGTLTIPAGGKVIGQFSDYGDVQLYAMNAEGTSYYENLPVTATWQDGAFVFNEGVYAVVSAGWLHKMTEITATESNCALTFSQTNPTTGAVINLNVPLLVKKTAENELTMVGFSNLLYGNYYETPFTINETANTVSLPFGVTVDKYVTSTVTRNYVLGGITTGLVDLVLNVATTDDSSELTAAKMFLGYNTSGTSYSGYTFENVKFAIDFNIYTAEPEVEPVDPSQPVIAGIHYQSDLENKTTEVIGCDDTLTSLDIPSTITVEDVVYTVTSVKEAAFQANKTISSITFPASIKTVGTDAFRNVTNLKTLNIEDLAAWVTVDFANGNANPIYNVYPTSTSNKWGKVYVAGQEVSKTLVIPEGVQSIGRAFYGFKPLTNLTLPESLEVMGDQAFANCERLTEVNIPANVTKIGSSFFGCKALKTVTFAGDNVKEIGKSAFYNCVLDTITLPANLETIGSMAFSGNSTLTGISFPASVTEIGMMAFYGCDGLKSIKCDATVPPTAGAMAFEDVGTTIPVYVPVESIDAYKAAEVWKDFTNYFGTDVTGISSAFDDSEAAPAVYYDLQGVRVQNPSAGVYIVRQGSKTTKVYRLK